MMVYGDIFREVRKLFQQSYNTHEQARHALPLINHGASKLLPALLETPENMLSHVREYVVVPIRFHIRPTYTLHFFFSKAGATILLLAYGYNTKPNDPLVKLVKQSNDDFSEVMTPGSFLVDLLPPRESAVTLNWSEWSN